MKKQFYNLFIIISLFFSFLSNKLIKAVETVPPHTNMDEVFKNIDFEQMLKELEEIFGTDLEEKEKKAETKKDKITPEAKKEALTPIVKKETLQECFENPAKPEKEEKVITKLSKEKLQAFDHYINNFSKQIKKLEGKISGFKLGIAFKEKLEELAPSKQYLDNYKNIISNIEKNLSTIEGRKPNPKRKMYKKVFFLPIFTNLRKQIIKQTKELKEVNNGISVFEKMSEEEKEKTEVEELEALARKKLTTIRVPEQLQKDIINIFKKLKDTAEKLEAVTTSNQAKSLIESKKKKREEEIKKAEEKRKSEQRTYRPTYYPSRAGRPGTYWPAEKDEYWWGGPSSAGAPSYVPSTKNDMETKPSEFKPEEKNEERPVVAQKKEKSEQEKNKEIIENLSQNTINLIEDVLKPNRYKTGDEKSYEEILETHSLSKIAQNIDEISKLKSKTEAEKKEQKTLTKKIEHSIETSMDKKLEDALKKFVPACIRLAKHYGGSEDQKIAAQNIIKELKTSNLQKTTNTEISKYEDEVLRKIDPKVLTEYDPQSKLDSILKNLNVALNWPISSLENIDKKKTEVLVSVDKGLEQTQTFENLLNPMKTPFDIKKVQPIGWQLKFEQERKIKSDKDIQIRLRLQEKKLKEIRSKVTEEKSLKTKKGSMQARQTPQAQLAPESHEETLGVKELFERAEAEYEQQKAKGKHK